MNSLTKGMAIFFATAAISACSTTNDTPATVNLTSSTIALSALDTTGSTDASLSCNCPCDINNMMVSGDTNVIHFNLAELHGQHVASHHIVAIVHSMDADSGKTYSCTFSFMMHDPMVMGGMQDYNSSIIATYRR